MKHFFLQAKEAQELEKYLDDKSAELVLEERNLKQAVSVVKQEREFLDDEKKKFHSEIQQMENLNKISESKVTLRSQKVLHVVICLRCAALQ